MDGFDAIHVVDFVTIPAVSFVALTPWTVLPAGLARKALRAEGSRLCEVEEPPCDDVCLMTVTRKRIREESVVEAP